MTEKPNIIFVHVDQLKQSAIGAYGCDQVQTPHMDQIISDGVCFDRSYCTAPICVPARTSWYTGLEPEQSGITTNGRWIDRSAVEAVDLGTWLRDQAGYDSVYMGKWHVALRPQECGFRQLHGSNAVGEYGDTPVARAAEDFLLNGRGAEPFFLSVGLLNPHDICYWNFHYTPGKFNLAQRVADQLPPLPPNIDYERGEKNRTPEQWQFYTHDYYRLTEMVDEEIGRIYRAYQRSPQRANTIFIFSSDHGHGNGEHGYATKGSPYEHSLRVPLTVIDPQAAPRRDTSHWISGLDMAPTLCDYAGVPSMPRNNGKSFKSLVRNGQAEWRDWLPASTPDLRHRVMMKGDYKLIYTRKGGGTQLFDLKNDPWEMTDLSGVPAHAEALGELLALRETYDAGREVCPMAQADLDRWK